MLYLTEDDGHQQPEVDDGPDDEGEAGGGDVGRVLVREVPGAALVDAEF